MAAMAIRAPTATAPGQPSWTRRSIQPLWAEGTGHWVWMRISRAGIESTPQKALNP